MSFRGQGDGIKAGDYVRHGEFKWISDASSSNTVCVCVGGVLERPLEATCF